MSANVARSGRPSGYAFASPRYLAMMHGYLVASAPAFAQKLGARRFSICEVYVGVPPEINHRARVSITWSVGADAPLAFSLSEEDDVDIKLVGTWEVLRRLAEIPFTSETTTAVIELLAHATAAGDLTMTQRGHPPGFMRTMHNDLVSWTATQTA